MRIIFRLLAILTFVAILAGVIIYARGYRIDITGTGGVTPTGIIAVSAYPKGSKVYINDILRGATDLNTTLPPGKYKVEVKKEGYTTWRKEIVLKGELVQSLDVLLFPVNPSLYPLTNLGITKAINLGPTERILLFSQTGDILKDGIYIFDSNRTPISFLPPLKPVVLKSLLPVDADFLAATVVFSPDYKQALVNFPLVGQAAKNLQPSPSVSAGYTYLLSMDNENKEIFNIADTASKQAILDAWEKEQNQEMVKVLEALPKEINKIATDSFKVIAFSPDKTKLLYQALSDVQLPLAIKPQLIAVNQTNEDRNIKRNNLYVYDKKEDRNYFILSNQTEPQLTDKTNQSANPPTDLTDTIHWYIDSQHLITNEGKRITVIDYDNTNKQTVYSGPFEKSFLSVAADGKLLVLLNLNGEISTLPDVYAIGIR